MENKILRTPESHFENIDFPFKANYLYVDKIRMHYIDENADSHKIIVLLHGLPTWGYMYRKMIPILSKAGYRVIVPDLIGFGKSDKPKDKKIYSYTKNEKWLSEFLFEKLKLSSVNLLAHDWGGLIGLRMVALYPDKFSSVIATNTAFPRMEGINYIFSIWRSVSSIISIIPYSKLMNLGLRNKVHSDILKGYDAPFPSQKYKIAPRVFPKLVPIIPWGKETKTNKKLWPLLCDFDKPFLTIYSDKDPFTKEVEKDFIQYIKGAKEITHYKIKNGGHFLPEEEPELLSAHVIQFLKNKVYK